MSSLRIYHIFFFKGPATTEIYTFPYTTLFRSRHQRRRPRSCDVGRVGLVAAEACRGTVRGATRPTDRKSTRLNSSHVRISYAVFCLKKKIDAKLNELIT